MMILNFFTRRLLIVLARTHSVRSKPYSYQKKISPPQQGRINWLVSLLTTITKKTDFKKDSLFLRIMMLYVQWSSFTSLHNYWRFSNEIMWIQLHCVILFCARSRIAAFPLASNSFTRFWKVGYFPIFWLRYCWFPSVGWWFIFRMDGLDLGLGILVVSVARRYDGNSDLPLIFHAMTAQFCSWDC